MTLATAHAAGVGAAAGIGLDPSASVLPQIVLPSDFPPFFRDTHDLQAGTIFSDQPMQTGEARRRRVYLQKPSTIDVMMELNLTQAQAFRTWFEDTIRVGALDFAAQVANRGPGLRWYKARFVTTYTADYLGGIWFKISAKLLLFGAGSFSGPTPTSLIGSVSMALIGSAALTVLNPLSGGVTLALVKNTTVTLLTGGVTLALEVAVIPSFASASGSATVSGVGQVNVFEGVAHGQAGSNVVGLIANKASSSGTSTASGIPVQPNVGSAAGTSTANANAMSYGRASGSATVLGVSGAGGNDLNREDGTPLNREDGTPYIRET